MRGSPLVEKENVFISKKRLSILGEYKSKLYIILIDGIGQIFTVLKSVPAKNLTFYMWEIEKILETYRL